MITNPKKHTYVAMKISLFITLLYTWYISILCAIKHIPFYIRYPRLGVLSLFFMLDYISQYSIHRERSEKATLDCPPSELIYGETPFYSLKPITSFIDGSPHAFLDLGCGKGKLIYFMSTVHHIPATGIDIIPSYIKQASKLSKLLRYKTVRFIEASLWDKTLLKHEISKHTLIYVSDLCFSRSLQQHILSCILEAAPLHSIIITMAGPFTSPHVQLLKEEPIQFGWGKGSLYIHKLIPV